MDDVAEEVGAIDPPGLAAAITVLQPGPLLGGDKDQEPIRPRLRGEFDGAAATRGPRPGLVR
jgi:hypothetical protein